MREPLFTQFHQQLVEIRIRAHHGQLAQFADEQHFIDAGSKLDKAKSLGVPILDEPTFLKMCGD